MVDAHSKTPFGVNPDPLKWTEELNDTSDRSQASPSGGSWYNPAGVLLLAIPPGLFSLEGLAAMSVAKNTASDLEVMAALSTANNSRSDADLATYGRWGGGNANVNIDVPARVRKSILLTAKTTYYFVIKTDSGSMDSVLFRGSQTPSILRAKWASI